MSLATYENRYRPANLLKLMQGDLDRMFNVRPVLNAVENGHVVWTPRADVLEDDQQYLIEVELPGIATDDISLTMEDGVLSLTGQRPGPEQEGYLSLERHSGHFGRRFRLRDAGDSGQISATSSNGVLKVIVPKIERAKPRQSAVNAT